MWYTREYIFFSSTEHCAWAIISSKEFKSWVTRISFAFTVRENRMICCQIFCDLLLKSAFKRIFNVMQLILAKIKWNIKWKYFIQKFHDICLSYYFKINGVTSGTGTANPSAYEFTIVFNRVRVGRSLVFCVVFYRSLFVLFGIALFVSFFFWRLLVALWYLYLQPFLIWDKKF
jgi:hypothetical protein